MLEDGTASSEPEVRSDGDGTETLSSARFQEIALPHLDAVYRIARVLTSNEAEADDLTQETFTRALRAFDRFELRDYGARPWLLRILHNVFYTERSRRKREFKLPDEVDFDHFADEESSTTSQPLALDTVDWEQFDEEIKEAVAGLQPEYRLVLLLWAFEDLSYKEIAHVCGCALGTVMSRLYRARRQLSERLGDYARDLRLRGAEGG